MPDLFETDLHPGKPKILFVGIAHSTHTQSWIDLIGGARFNVRLFGTPLAIEPLGDSIRTYLCAPSPSNPKPLHRYMDQPYQQGGEASSAHEISRPDQESLEPFQWLASIINDWRPDIIHTLGIFDGQGGLFYYSVRQQYHLQGIGKWILQLRGGSDLALRRYNPQDASLITQIMQDCDEIITDNYANIAYVDGLGLGKKIASIAPVPGAGGVDIGIAGTDFIFPSRKERIILWPKAYESQWSKALPVIEALSLAWSRIKPCEVYITAATLEVREWYRTLPDELRQSSTIADRIPRNELMSLMERARVLLIPSLVDGVPNSLYEAMALGAFPIVSPLETIMPIVRAEINVLYARNLYPDEISEALIRAMSDDALVDGAASNNLELVKRIASRQVIAEQVVDYYENLAIQH